MIVEYVRYRVDAERAGAFLDAYGAASASLEASPHCLAYELARCEEDPTAFTLRIEWESAEAHLRGFRAGPHFGPFLRAVQPFVKDIEEMRHYARTPLHWARPR